MSKSSKKTIATDGLQPKYGIVNSVHILVNPDCDADVASKLETLKTIHSNSRGNKNFLENLGNTFSLDALKSTQQHLQDKKE
jgi:hypothetical protein